MCCVVVLHYTGIMGYFIKCVYWFVAFYADGD